MEIALNLLWLALAVVALLVWKLRLSRRPLPESPFLSNNVRLIALCCALVLLFFVISVSDDLQQATGLVEDAASRTSTPFKSKFNRAGSHDASRAPADAAILGGGQLLFPRVCVGRTYCPDTFLLSSITFLSLQGRSPPLAAS